MLTSFPQSPKSPHSADVSACLRAVGTLFTWQKHRCAWGAFAEKTPSYPSPSLECYPSPSLEWPGTRLWWYFAPASPTGQGKVQEHRPLLPVFQFSLLWWKGLRRDRFRSIEAVNKKKKNRLSMGWKKEGMGSFVCTEKHNLSPQTASLLIAAKAILHKAEFCLVYKETVIAGWICTRCVPSPEVA